MAYTSMLHIRIDESLKVEAADKLFPAGKTAKFVKGIHKQGTLLGGHYE